MFFSDSSPPDPFNFSELYRENGNIAVWRDAGLTAIKASHESVPQGMVVMNAVQKLSDVRPASDEEAGLIRVIGHTAYTISTWEAYNSRIPDIFPMFSEPVPACTLTSAQKNLIFQILSEKLESIVRNYIDNPERFAFADDVIYNSGPEIIPWYFGISDINRSMQGEAVRHLFMAMAFCDTSGLEKLRKFVSDSRYYVAASALHSMYSCDLMDIPEPNRRMMFFMAESQLTHASPWVRYVAANVARSFKYDLDVSPLSSKHDSNVRAYRVCARSISLLETHLTEALGSLDILVKHGVKLPKDVLLLQKILDSPLQKVIPDPGDFIIPENLQRSLDDYRQINKAAAEEMAAINRSTTANARSLVERILQKQATYTDLPLIHLSMKYIFSQWMAKEFSGESCLQSLKVLASFCKSFGEEGRFNYAIGRMVDFCNDHTSTVGLGRDSDRSAHYASSVQADHFIGFLRSVRLPVAEGLVPDQRFLRGPAPQKQCKVRASV